MRSLKTRLMFTLSIACISLSACLVGPNSLTGPVPEHTREADWSNWKIRVTTYNVWGLPLISKHINERMPIISSELRARNLDFAFLQEAWRDHDRAVLELGSSLNHSHYFPVSRTLGSGLFNLSREPIIRSSFREFSMNGQLEQIWRGDAYAGKGVGLTTSTLNGLPVSMLNTHTIARYGTDSENRTDRHSIDRLVQLFEIFRHLVEQTDSDAFILAGDFNMRHFHLEYDFWRNLTSLDGIRAEEFDSDICTFCPDNSFDGSNSGQLDYLFVSPRLSISRYERDYDRRFELSDGKKHHLSDHYGWTAEIVINSREPRPAPSLVRERTTQAVIALRLALQRYLKGRRVFDAEQGARGVEDRICRSCRAREVLEVVRVYEKVLNSKKAVRSRAERVIRTRLNSYFSLFRR